MKKDRRNLEGRRIAVKHIRQAADKFINSHDKVEQAAYHLLRRIADEIQLGKSFSGISHYAEQFSKAIEQEYLEAKELLSGEED